MPPRRGEGMTDTLSGRVHRQGSGIGGSHHNRIDPRHPRPAARFFAGHQPAFHRVSVKDLRPLRGRPPAESLTLTLNEAPPGTRRTTQNNRDHVVDTAPLLQEDISLFLLWIRHLLRLWLKYLTG